MPIDPDALLATVLSDVPVSYAERDAMLYALGVGLGSDPLDPRELPYVFEQRGLRIVPSMASMLIPDTIVAGTGCDLSQMLHRSQTLELFRPLLPSGKLLANQRVVAVADRGGDRGGEIEIETELRRADDDTVVCLLGSRLLMRGDGGFGGSPPAARARQTMPDRDVDLVCDLKTRPDQALLFRLSGDLNPLHADPRVAAAAGFSRPVLHGRCTYGIACHAILRTVCDYDYTLISGLDVRFSSPVYPGEVITTDMWQERNIVWFRCRVKARGVVVIDDGKCTLFA